MGSAQKEDLFARVAAARKDHRQHVSGPPLRVPKPYSEKRLRETPTVAWIVQCDHSGYRAEVIGPYHIKPGHCPACGRSATAIQKEKF